MVFKKIPAWEDIRELARFYQAAVINTIFGVGAYFVLVYFGLNIFLAQALSHVMGVCFNYFMYSRHVFRNSDPAKFRFVLSYFVNYLLSLGFLAGLAQVISSPYLAGLGATFLVSVINFFALKHLVFKPRAL